MKKKVFLIVLVVLFGGGLWLYNWVLGPTKPPSGPIQPVPIQAASSTAAAPATRSDPAATAHTASASAATAATASKTNASAGAANVPAPASATPMEKFQISQTDSNVKFMIYEELRGKPTNVVGTTNMVAGEAEMDPKDMSTARVGVIKIDARALATDNRHRNRAIRNRILSTDTYEYITFSPKKITGLTGAATPGSTHAFQIAGDLTVRDVTKPVVFDGTLKLDSNNRISVQAKTTVQREDFHLTIPNLRFLANVAEKVGLEIDAVLVPMTDAGSAKSS